MGIDVGGYSFDGPIQFGIKSHSIFLENLVELVQEY